MNRLHNTSYYGSQNFEQLTEEEERFTYIDNLLDDTGNEQSSPGVNCRGFLKRAAQPTKALEIELVKKLSNMDI